MWPWDEEAARGQTEVSNGENISRKDRKPGGTRRPPHSDRGTEASQRCGPSGPGEWGGVVMEKESGPRGHGLREAPSEPH